MELTSLVRCLLDNQRSKEGLDEHHFHTTRCQRRTSSCYPQDIDPTIHQSLFQ